MSVRVAQTSFRPEFFADFVGFVSPNMPDVYMVRLSDGNVITIHDDEITEFFYV
jgi:hypothetical protein